MSYKIPNLLLTNPNRKELALIPQSGFKDLKATLRFNALSELSFKVYNKIIIRGETIINPNYNLFKKKRLIYVDDLGIKLANQNHWFEISEATERIDGDFYYKDINCYSYEYTLNAKSVNLLSGTYEFYDEIDNTNTMMGKILKVCPSWSIGTIDSELWNRKRTFDVPDATVYGFLMADVEKAYECIFTFDNENLKINATIPTKIVKNTDIVLTFDNLIKNVEIKENSNDIITGLAIHGAGDLDIRNVNPLGTSMIYNFDYYKNDEWMEQDLIDAINTWETLIENNNTAYSDNLLSLKTYNSELLTLKTTLTDLQGQLKAKEVVRSDLMTLDLTVPANKTEYDTVCGQIDTLNSSIATKQSEITAKESQIASVNTALTGIRSTLSFENNFTTAQILELDKLIYTGTYQNENYIQTDNMTLVEIQEMAEELLQQGKNAFVKLFQPMYTFSMDSMNFLFIEKFKPFVNQFELGCLINAEVKRKEWVSPILLEVSIDYDNPSEFNMTFGNRFRLSTAEWTFADLYEEQNKTSNFVNANSDLMTKPVKSGMVDEVSAYMKNNLNLAKQTIETSTDQDFTIGSYGIWGKKKNEDGTFDTHQIRIANNILAMTDDNWATVRLALGIINGKSSIIADVIAGKLIAGNDLLITNDTDMFRVDHDGLNFTQTDDLGSFRFHVGKEDGVTIENGNIVLTNATNKILIDPTNGFKIQKKVGETWVNILNADAEGNLELTGNVSALSFKSQVKNAEGVVQAETILDSTKQVMRALDGSGNMQDVLYFDAFAHTFRFNGLVTIDTSVINDLYSKNANVANLTVNGLRSDFEKPYRYLSNDTSDMQYIKIKGNDMRFIHAQCLQSSTVQFTTEDGQNLYWTNDSHTAMTTNSSSGLPVIIWSYFETPMFSVVWQSDTATPDVFSHPHFKFQSGGEGSFNTTEIGYDNQLFFKMLLTNTVDAYERGFTIEGSQYKIVGQDIETGKTAEKVWGKSADGYQGWATAPTGSGGDTSLLRAKLVRELTDGFQITFEDDTVHNYNVTTIDANTFRLTDESGFYTDFVSL